MSKAEKLLTRVELAAALDPPVHKQTVTIWTAEGCPVAEVGRRGVPHKYRKSDVVAWLEVRKETKESGGVVDLTKARAEKEYWLAKLAEQKHQTLEGELLPADEVRRTWAAEVTAIRTRLLAWPTTIADKLHRAATLEGVVGIENVLQEAVREVLTELADPDRDDSKLEAPAAKKKKRRRSSASRKKAARKKAPAAKKKGAKR